jgi:hypothetical protein
MPRYMLPHLLLAIAAACHAQEPQLQSDILLGIRRHPDSRWSWVKFHSATTDDMDLNLPDENESATTDIDIRPNGPPAGPLERLKIANS